MQGLRKRDREDVRGDDGMQVNVDESGGQVLVDSSAMGLVRETGSNSLGCWYMRETGPSATDRLVQNLDPKARSAGSDKCSRSQLETLLLKLG